MTEASKEVPGELLDALREHDSFVLTSHVNPDGDAIGSSLGMARVLQKLGKKTLVWMRDPVPRVYSSLVGSEDVHVGEDAPEGFPDRFDAAVILECPNLARTGLEMLNALPLINLDHHLGNENYGAVNWFDQTAAAAGELVFRVARALDVEVDEALADTLYLTLVTDTGGFRYSNTIAETFEVASALVRAGASPQRTARRVYESQSEAAVRLLGEMLTTLELHGDDRSVATARLTRDMIERTGAAPGDTEGLINHPRSIAGVEAVALLREVEGGWKASLRGQGKVNVEAIARSYGGGGHHNAAGFTRKNESGPAVDADELQREVVARLLEGIAQHVPEEDASKGERKP